MPDGTAPPGSAPAPPEVTAGVQPRYLPDNPPEKSLTWPDRDHDTVAVRVSITVIAPRSPANRYSPSLPLT